ncbi:MAG: hypothetical protein R3B81_19045 [bacterium]
MNVRRFTCDVRIVGVVAGVLVIVAALGASRWLGWRAECARTDARIEQVRAETAELSSRLDDERLRRSRLPASQRGNGPGGIRAAVEDLFFEGPTAARSAMALTFEADAAGFTHWRYESDESAVVDRFPPESDAMEATPVRRRVDLVRWPTEFRLETDWTSTVALLERLGRARPAFGLETFRVEPHRDETGALTDRLVVQGSIATYWFVPEE